MQVSPEEIPAVIRAHRATLEEEISQKQSVLKILSSFSETSFESCFDLATAIDRSSPELSTPKEDFYMSFEEIKKILRSRLPSILAFGALLIGMICFLVLGIKTAFTDVYVLMGGGYSYKYEVVFDGLKSVLIMLPTVLTALSIASMVSRLAGGGRKWMIIGLILCVLSALTVLLLPGDVKEYMYLHEYMAYRYSFMHNILPGKNAAMDFFIASLKFIPHIAGAVLIIVGLFREKTLSE